MVKPLPKKKNGILNQLPAKTFQQTNKRPFGSKPTRPSSPKRSIDLQMYFLMKLCTSHIVRFHVRLSWVVSGIQPPFPTSVGNIPQSFFQENRKESSLNLGLFLDGSTCALNTGPEYMYQHPSKKPNKEKFVSIKKKWTNHHFDANKNWVITWPHPW